MRLALYTRITIIFLSLFVAPVAPAADDKDLAFPKERPSDRDDEPADLAVDQPDTVFIDIKMSNGTVVGQDTYGNWWQYDFENRAFVSFRPEESVENDPSEPVEVRCTERKRVLPATYNDVLIGYDEYVQGDVFAIGRVVVSGWVQGDVQSVNGEVVVNPSGQVDGKIKAPLVQIRPGGIVSGETFITTDSNLSIDFITRHAMLIVLIITLLFLFIGFLLVSLMPRQLEIVGACMTRFRVRSFFIGLLTALIIAPICVAVLALTVIGWIVVPVASLVGVAMGIVCYGNKLGMRILSRRSVSNESMMVPSLLGMSLFSLVWFGVVWLAMSPAGIVQALGVILLFILTLFTFYPFLSGLGASLLTRFGFHEYVGLAHTQREEIEAPAPPPLPESPPVFRSSKDQFPEDLSPGGSTPPLTTNGE